MTGPWDPMAAASRGGMRVSDADRDRVLGTLQAAFARGLLARDDFDTRAAQALASRTAAELAAVIAGLTASQQPAPARMSGTSRRSISPKLVALGAALIVLPAALVAAFLTFYGGFIVLFLVACVGTVLSATPPGPHRRGPLP